MLDEHIVFDNTLFIPPRRDEASLDQGRARDTTASTWATATCSTARHTRNSIGAAVTHGCVRLRDEDIEWLYENVPVGTKVYIY